LWKDYVTGGKMTVVGLKGEIEGGNKDLEGKGQGTRKFDGTP